MMNMFLLNLSQFLNSGSLRDLNLTNCLFSEHIFKKETKTGVREICSKKALEFLLIFVEQSL